MIDFLDQIVNGGATFGIFERGDVPGGLVEQDVDWLALRERLAVEEDQIAVEINPVVGVFDDFAVYLNLAGVNPASGLGSRSCAGF